MRKVLQGVSGCILFTMMIQPGFALERYKRGESPSDGVSYTVGLEYEEGDYGTGDTTEVWRIPVGLDYRKGQFLAGAYIPYISAESTGNITISSMRMRTVITSSSSDASGIGDLKMYAGYNIPAKGSPDQIYHVIGYIKLPTANENKGLGTGETDYAIEGGLLFKVDKAVVYTNLGYQITGDTPTTNYKDVLYANVSATLPQASGNSIGASLDFSQSATPGFDDALEITGYMNMPLENKRSLYLYLQLGLTDGSPDYGIGANYRFK